MQLNSIEEIIEDFKEGKMVILMDDEDRENEGDLIISASAVKAEDVNFMATNGRGLICLTLTKQRCEQLNLPLMVSQNNDQHGTNFTMSIEAARGVTTGISAGDRAVTVQMAVAENAKPQDIVQPGHIFPLMAKPGGVLTRAGHTEAGCDLAKLAGHEPAAVIVEILNEDGTMARRPDLEKFAKQHDLKIGTVADLIHYRMQHEKTIECVTSSKLATEYGEFILHGYKNLIDESLHFAIVFGDISKSTPLVRVHIQNSLCDLFSNIREDCGWPLNDALKRIADEGQGVLVMLRLPESTDELIQRIKNYAIQDESKKALPQSSSDDLRTFGIGAQILRDLGIRHMRVLSAPKKLHGLSGFDLEIDEYVQS
ncbi:MAG: bifunctional 3,4-dihydroxy-2-butanone-4-phosphate synthase/GTP cyclohydrolase II [Gammaproteobacteria bacterium]